MQYIWLYGWHVLEAIVRAKKRKIRKIYAIEQHMYKLEKMEIDAPITIIQKKELDAQFGQNHQGIAFYVEQIKFWELNEWLENQNENSFLIACDLIEDPRNLGAIIRTAAAFNVSGLLITKNKTAPFEASLAKSAAGGLEYLEIIQVPNLANSLKILQKNDYFVYGLDSDGKASWNKIPRCVLVLGQEGNGLRQLTKQTCDAIISITTRPDFGVLNVSVAAAIAIHQFKSH